MPAVNTVLNIILCIDALVLIVSVLMQQGNTAGLGSIGGMAETYLGKNKARGLDAKLALITKASAITFIVLALAMSLISGHFM